MYDVKWVHQIVPDKRLSTHNKLSTDVAARISITAASIEELASKMRVPVKTVKATIERYKTTIEKYNELARVGKDLDFGKRSDRYRPPA